MGSKQIAPLALLKALFWPLLLISSSNCKFLKIGPYSPAKLQPSATQRSTASGGRRFMPKQGTNPMQSSHTCVTSVSRAFTLLPCSEKFIISPAKYNKAYPSDNRRGSLTGLPLGTLALASSTWLRDSSQSLLQARASVNCSQSSQRPSPSRESQDRISS